MSDTESKLLERIAALETQLAPTRKNADKPVFDLRAATLNPIHYLQSLGLDIQHTSRHFVANALGKDCPPDLAAMVQMGPQIAATSHLEALVTSLSRKVDDLVSGVQKDKMVASAKTTTVDPVKYPTLASAHKTDSSLLERELASLGDIADKDSALKMIEDKLSQYAKAFNFKPAAASTNATETIQNPDGTTKSEFKPANSFSSEVPPLLPNASGAMNPEKDEQLKQAILNKYKDVS